MSKRYSPSTEKTYTVSDDDSEIVQRIQYLEDRYVGLLEMEQRMKQYLAIHREKTDESLRLLYISVSIMLAVVFVLVLITS